MPSNLIVDVLNNMEGSIALLDCVIELIREKGDHEEHSIVEFLQNAEGSTYLLDLATECTDVSLGVTDSDYNIAQSKVEELLEIASEQEL